MVCLACAMPGWPLCDPCVVSLTRSPPRVIQGVAVEAGFRHVGAAARLVHNLKYRRSIPAGRILAAAMLSGVPSDATMLVPVPRSLVRRVAYGIDQAWVLATEVARLTGLPVADALGAPLWWRRQAGAPREGRHAINFRRTAEILDGAILVDDVCTTGATAMSAIAVSCAEGMSLLVATSAGTMESGTQPFPRPGGDVTEMREMIGTRLHAAPKRSTSESTQRGTALLPRPVESINREEIG